jgi:hypothetical protein
MTLTRQTPKFETIQDKRRAHLDVSRSLVHAIHIEPTFPIDELRIRKRFREKLSQSPHLFIWLFIGLSRNLS